MDTARKIKFLRKQHGWSQEQLGDLLDVSYMTVRRWETGKSYPALDMVGKMAKLFNISVSSLTDDKTEGTLENFYPNFDKKIEPTIEKKGNEKLATLSLGGDKNVTAPATPEGYAFLERIYAMSMGHVATA